MNQLSDDLFYAPLNYSLEHQIEIFNEKEEKIVLGEQLKKLKI